MKYRLFAPLRKVRNQYIELLLFYVFLRDRYFDISIFRVKQI